MKMNVYLMEMTVKKRGFEQLQNNDGESMETTFGMTEPNTMVYGQ